MRQVEALVQELTSDREAESGREQDGVQARIPTSRPRWKNSSERLGTRVRIVELSEQRGRIEIEYYSQAELDRLCSNTLSGSHDRLVPAAGVEPATYGL